jgi:hypothetical protein
MPKSPRFILFVVAALALIVWALPASASNMQSPLRQETPTETPADSTATTEPTAEPTTEPTVDATATVDVTATATTSAPIELLENGGFENRDEDDKPLLDPWVHEGNPGEKVKCNQDTKVFAHTGDCAFRFKGNPLKSGVVKQTVDLTGFSVGEGDTLTLTLWINGKIEAAGKGKVKVKFADGAKAKGNAPFANTNGEWVQIEGDVLLEGDDVSQVTVQLKHAGKAGKFLVDDVSLLLTKGDAPTATPTVEVTGTPDGTPASTETPAALLPLP